MVGDRDVYRYNDDSNIYTYAKASNNVMLKDSVREQDRKISPQDYS